MLARGSWRAGAGVAVFAVMVVVQAACQTPPEACPQSACGYFATISAELHVPTSELLAGKTKVCRRDRCSELVPSTQPRVSPTDRDHWLDPTGDLLGGNASVHDFGDGWSRIDFTLGLFQKGADGTPEKAPDPQDGDPYRFTVLDRDGKALLDVDRGITYWTQGHTCDGAPCRKAAIALAADSRTGLSCGALPCMGRVTLHKRFMLDREVARMASVTACHNEHCGTVIPGRTADTPSTDLMFQSTFVEVSAGVFDVTYELDVPLAALRDGDRYRMNVTRGSEVLAWVDQVVTYEATFPNGPDCDPQACRTAVIELH